MVRLQYASDIHLDQLTEYLPSDLIRPNADVLILGGDICHFYVIEKHSLFFDYIANSFQYIVYVPGNHEFYTKTKDLSINMLENRAKQFLHKYPNIFYLNNSSVFINNILFTGSCLWCTPSVDPPEWFMINLTKQDITKLCNESVDYLNKVSDMNKNQFRHIVVTHYPPIRIAYAYALNEKNEKRLKYRKYEEYYQNQDIILKYPPSIWIFGHIHKNMSMYLNNTLYLSNQRKDNNYNREIAISI